jgi:3-hydroxyacyl-[acyl-carrier-protein] dehydratase
MRLEYFQLIDRVIEVDTVGRSIRTEAMVPTASTIFEGHFPGYPLMPGVLLIEAMAQTSGWLVMGINKFERMPFLASVNEAKLRRFVTPGERLALSAKLVHEGSGYAVTEASVEVGGKPICDATIMFRVMPFPTDQFRVVMQERAAEIAFPMGAPTHG